jgi:hypothetical protein
VCECVCERVAELLSVLLRVLDCITNNRITHLMQ